MTGSLGRSRCPPERFHVFVSHTTHEEEVRIIKPIVDRFLNNILRPIIEQKLGEPPVFYDGYSLYNPSRSWMLNEDLEMAIRFAIEESEVLMAFVSPEYHASRWCRLEYETMSRKELRPWFDLCRKAPIPELRDRRLAGRRPEWWECVCAHFMMRLLGALS